MGLEDFTATLRTIRKLSKGELQAVGVCLEPGEWQRFRGNPALWFTEASDGDLRKIWKVVEWRRSLADG